MKVLIIEDDENVLQALSLCLQLRWPEVAVSTVAEGTERVQMSKSESFDIIILDINLPDIDGFEVLKRIRPSSNVPIIMVTVRGKEEDQVRGLEMGADDYIVKPFKPRDLIARVNAVLRRTPAPITTTGKTSVVRGGLILNLATNEVHLREEIIELTQNECKMLHVLMNNVDHTISDKEIMRDVWRNEDLNTDRVRTYIHRLRNKLHDNPPQIILSKRGEGYRFTSPT